MPTISDITRLSRKATLLALWMSVPLVGLASYMWLIAPGREWYEQAELYEIADPIYYYLGAPLTHLICVFREMGQLSDRDHWWALPLINVLFVVQWIIWAQAFTVSARLLDLGLQIAAKLRGEMPDDNMLSDELLAQIPSRSWLYYGWMK